jgi:phage host-nuclease inhibitor protein Gam
MATNRIKLTRPAIKSRAEMEIVLAEVRGHTLERNRLQLVSETRKKMVDDECGAQITVLVKIIEERVELLRGWAEANPAEFHGLKSLETPQGSLGWRVGNFTLKTLAGFTWDRVLEKFQSLPKFAGYVRQKFEVNKQAVLVDREQIPPEELRAAGLRVVQEELFFVEPNIEEIENRQTSSAGP